MTPDEFRKMVEEQGGTWIDPATEKARVTLLGPKGAKALAGGDQGGTSGSGGGDVPAAMSEQQIRDAGLMIDVPFESGEAKPSRLRYADFEVEDDEPVDMDEWRKMLVERGVVAADGTQSAPPTPEAEAPGEPSADE